MWSITTGKISLTKFRSDILIVLFSVLFVSIHPDARGQQNLLSDSATIKDCLKYAFRNQPLIKQLKLDEGITKENIRIALADWLPQINASANLQHYLEQPKLLFPDITNPSGPKILIQSGVLYNSGITLSASQNIFNADVYIAGRTARTYRLQSAQTSRSAVIEMVVEISKAFYDVLLSEEQLNLINEQITRLNKSLKDAYTHFQNGTNDMIDYKRATISLNNAMAQKKSALESINAKTSYLKQLMGYPGDKVLNLTSNIRSLEKEILLDTLQYLDVNNRIEYQLLQTNLRLQKSRIDYYRFGMLPSLTAFANYNYVYQNDQFSDLYKTYYPNSTIGLSLTLPIFQGTKRLQNIRKSKMEYERLALDTIRTRNEMNTQYVSAMASYKSNLDLYNATSRNSEIAREVYNTVKLQYDQGVKSYLEVIVSETDLMSARINNLNALFMLMFSKLDVQRASGSISVDY
ncbi:MAG TPA: TolC family protein [Ignavibacteriaceae bacterium]